MIKPVSDLLTGFGVVPEFARLYGGQMTMLLDGRACRRFDVRSLAGLDGHGFAVRSHDADFGLARMGLSQRTSLSRGLNCR